MATLRTIAPAVRSGTFTLPATAVPASGAELALLVVADLPVLAEREDAGLSFALTVEQSQDGLTGWRIVAGVTWRGHPPGVEPWTSPGFAVAVAPLRGAFIRATLTIPVALTLGATVSAA